MLHVSEQRAARNMKGDEISYRFRKQHMPNEEFYY
jgi:hypothetical protein